MSAWARTMLGWWSIHRLAASWRRTDALPLFSTVPGNAPLMAPNTTPLLPRPISWQGFHWGPYRGAPQLSTQRECLAASCHSDRQGVPDWHSKRKPPTGPSSSASLAEGGKLQRHETGCSPHTRHCLKAYPGHAGLLGAGLQLSHVSLQPGTALLQLLCSFLRLFQQSCCASSSSPAKQPPGHCQLAAWRQPAASASLALCLCLAVESHETKLPHHCPAPACTHRPHRV